MDGIPVPKAVNIKSALEQLGALERFGGISREDTIEKRLRVLMVLFDCVEPETYGAIKRQYDIVKEFYGKKPPE